MKTIGSKILVSSLKPEEAVAKQKIGSLEIPMSTSGETQSVKVISVGPDVPGLMPGDILYIYPGAGTKFTHTDGQTYQVISVPDVLVVL